MGVLKENAKVRVRFDMHDAETVRLLDHDSGKFLALGIWDGHRRAAYPVAFVDQLAEKRAQGIKRLAQQQIDRADDELKVTYDGTGSKVLPFGQVPVYSEQSLTPSVVVRELTKKAAPVDPDISFAELVYAKQVEDEAAARAAALLLPPEETFEERLMRYQAAEALARVHEPEPETFDEMCLRQLEQQQLQAEEELRREAL